MTTTALYILGWGLLISSAVISLPLCMVNILFTVEYFSQQDAPHNGGICLVKNISVIAITCSYCSRVDSEKHCIQYEYYRCYKGFWYVEIYGDNGNETVLGFSRIRAGFNKRNKTVEMEMMTEEHPQNETDHCAFRNHFQDIRWGRPDTIDAIFKTPYPIIAMWVGFGLIYLVLGGIAAWVSYMQKTQEQRTRRQEMLQLVKLMHKKDAEKRRQVRKLWQIWGVEHRRIFKPEKKKKFRRNYLQELPPEIMHEVILYVTAGKREESPLVEFDCEDKKRTGDIARRRGMI